MDIMYSAQLYIHLIPLFLCTKPQYPDHHMPHQTAFDQFRVKFSIHCAIDPNLLAPKTARCQANSLPSPSEPHCSSLPQQAHTNNLRHHSSS
ncbi:hypothetical protein NA56DRAFT_387957 [Hyaloscypha hepaticicola]|uniref:Uncharacterized protein n=1 Tax=Hyaloscypha hepaticicola TaxID=2082293 RepID=A0A2J6QHW6_9HELO|nr:hypothetical protein NA56DRAFT_387957 [Hyaloscypha hepaticicola]